VSEDYGGKFDFPTTIRSFFHEDGFWKLRKRILSLDKQSTVTREGVQETVIRGIFHLTLVGLNLTCYPWIDLPNQNSFSSLYSYLFTSHA
jgi:hypothetical protein